MYIQIYGQSEVTILKIYGRFDKNLTKIINNQFRSLIFKKKYNIVLDFTNVLSLNSIGLGLMVALLKETHKIGGDICLIGVSDSNKILLELTGFDQIFKVFEDVSHAVESFNINQTNR